jgi:hypothetical protein
VFVRLKPTDILGRLITVNNHILTLDLLTVSPKVFLLPNPGQKAVTVSGKALTILEQRYRIEKTKKPNLSFAAFISEAALMERRNILKEAQFISVIGFEDNTLIIRDLRKAGQLIEVQIKNKKLKCIADDDFDCIHVGFALALPEVRMALKNMH